jgi:hypothetical protein
LWDLPLSISSTIRSMGKVKVHQPPHRFGNAHRQYRKPWNLKKIDPIIKTLLATDGMSLRSLSRNTSIPFETLRRWKLKVTENPRWSHRTMDVKAAAASLNIQLHYVPAGMTDALQPLDRSIFGALKAHARRLFRLRVRDNPTLRRTKQEAAQEMIIAWDMITPATLAAGWDIYEGEPWDLDPEIPIRTL